MRTRRIALAVVTLFVAGSVCFAADDAFMGTWKLNEAQSKIPAGDGKTVMAVWIAAGDSVKVTTDGVDASGQPTHGEWAGKFNGKEYPLTGYSDVDMRSYTRVNDHRLRISETKGGKVVVSATISVSADGKTRTVVVTRTDANGNKVTTTRVYDKQ